MAENQKDQQVAGNQGGQQNQDNRDNQIKNGGPTEKASAAVVGEDDEQTDIPNEYTDQTRQQEDMVPAEERNHQEKNKGGSQRESTGRDANKSESPNQGGNQNKNPNSSQAAVKSN